ncbi:MSMEG_0570 family nitrogen starvation response protein [Pseudonocardia sp.]|uniref:MSMEG_0570 family nitrogen starvation response protein n=1 Tax=Pseudonocardia sp. TaxID=60912 RepID=UPI003D0A2C49
MPDVVFDVRWPDGSTQSFYSPSLIVKDYFEAGAEYTLDDFVARTREAMTLADERVRAKYGMGCSESAMTLAGVEYGARRFATRGDAGAADGAAGTVTVERFRSWGPPQGY